MTRIEFMHHVKWTPSDYIDFIKKLKSIGQWIEFHDEGLEVDYVTKILVSKYDFLFPKESK